MKMTFVIHEPNQPEPRTVRVETGLTLGRHPQCGCVLQDAAVSARHARVVDQAGVLFLEDLGGTNPTRVDGQPLAEGQQAAMVNGTNVVIGQTRIDVQVEGAPASPDSTAMAPMEPAAPAATMVAPMEVPAAPPDPQATVVGGPPPPAGEATVVGEAPSPPPPSAPVREPARTDPEAMHAEPVPASARPAPGSPSAGDQTLATLVYGEQTFDPNDPHQVLALEAALRAVRPRLVFANEADRRIVDITKASITIGRSRSVEIQVEHPGVSSEHSKLTFDGQRNRFLIEDLGGTNKTYVNNEMLTAGNPRELSPEAHLRFGPIDALFVVDSDSEGVSISEKKYEAATEVLARENAIQPSQRSQAQTRAKSENRHVGEMLLAMEIVTIRQWRRAFQQGEVLLLTQKPKGARPSVDLGGKGKLYALIAVAVVVVVVVLVVVLK